MTQSITRFALAVAPNFGLTKFLDPLRIPPVIKPRPARNEIEIEAVRTTVSLHSELPETPVWAYEGHFPGPTIEARGGRRLRISWKNGVEGTIPLVAARVPFDPTNPANNPINTPGFRNPDGSLPDGVSIIEGVADLPAWLVTHLHGADTDGGNDGWAHNGILHGRQQRVEYPNEQRAAGLWYHDHAMAVTRFTVYAGLTGMYLLRDQEELGLGLPDGDLEIPLVLTDRNLDTDPDGGLTGQLLFKVPYVQLGDEIVHLPVGGPFSLVNGVLWPHLDVEARWHRFRVLNATNARFYRLNLFTDDGTDVNHLVRQIGTDGGLLPKPVPLPAGGLPLGPAERADLLIDFGADEFRGRQLRLRDTAVFTDPGTGQPVIEPDIMEFRVEDRARHDRFTLPDTVSRSYVRIGHNTLPHDHDHVFVALVPPGSAGSAHPQMWELAEITDPARVPAQLPAEGVIQIQDPHTGTLRTFERVAAAFDDRVSIFIDHNRWAVWNFVHFDTLPPQHPMHIHLTQFQALGRKRFTPQFDVATGGTTTPATGFEDVPLEHYETGWKDTIVVNPGEWVSVAGRFGDSTGEFMYHCHILDHEDEGMMRPFVVHPPEIARFHRSHGGHGHGHGV